MNDEAQYNVGNAYKRGEGVEKNFEEAVKWWRFAAEQGGVDAQFNLGVCYYKGTGVEEDLEEAVKWYRLAAEKGNEDAKEALKDLQNGKSRGKIYKNREIQ